jgi:hypothetical protein
MAVVAPRRLSKEESRRRFRELCDLWNEYDPIGCMTVGAPADEYEAYVGQMMRLLERDAPVHEVYAYVKREVTGHMGVTWHVDLDVRTVLFAHQCRDWFDQGWRGTIV